MSTAASKYKTRVKEAFSKHADTYELHAELQAHAANLTAEMLRVLKTKTALPDGDLLEIGCGTGFLTRRLIEIFPERNILSTDISEEMLNACRIRTGSARNLKFLAADAEDFSPSQEFALIASSFAFQWFLEPRAGIKRLLSFLKPGGILIFSVPGELSCPRWKAASEKLSVPFTRNPLPHFEDFETLAHESGTEFKMQSQFFQETYPDALSMLRSLKEIGANTQRHELQLSCPELRKLMRLLDSEKPVEDEFQVISGYFRRLK